MALHDIETHEIAAVADAELIRLLSGLRGDGPDEFLDGAIATATQRRRLALQKSGLLAVELRRAAFSKCEEAEVAASQTALATMRKSDATRKSERVIAERKHHGGPDTQGAFDAALIAADKAHYERVAQSRLDAAAAVAAARVTRDNEIRAMEARVANIRGLPERAPMYAA